MHIKPTTQMQKFSLILKHSGKRICFLDRDKDTVHNHKLMQKNATTICIQKYGFGCAGRYLQYGYYHDSSWIVSHFLNGEKPKVGGRG